MDSRGIIPRAIDDIFAYIENDTSASRKYLVRASYLQIYNEVRGIRYMKNISQL